MALYRTPEEHAANPPSTWQVVRVDPRRWNLTDQRGAVIDSYPTRRAAEAARQSSNLTRLYDDEGRWYRGEPVRGWRPYAEVAAGRPRSRAPYRIARVREGGRFTLDPEQFSDLQEARVWAESRSAGDHGGRHGAYVVIQGDRVVARYEHGLRVSPVAGGGRSRTRSAADDASSYPVHAYGAAERRALDRSGDGTSYAVVRDLTNPRLLVLPTAAARRLSRSRYVVEYTGPRYLSADAMDAGRERWREHLRRPRVASRRVRSRRQRR